MEIGSIIRSVILTEVVRLGSSILWLLMLSNRRQVLLL